MDIYVYIDRHHLNGHKSQLTYGEYGKVVKFQLSVCHNDVHMCICVRLCFFSFSPFLCMCYRPGAFLVPLWVSVRVCMLHTLWTLSKIDVTNILLCAIQQIRHSNPIFDHVDVTSMRPIHCDLNKLPLSKIHTNKNPYTTRRRIWSQHDTSEDLSTPFHHQDLSVSTTIIIIISILLIIGASNLCHHSNPNIAT